jgi:lipopolysaccharide export system protein LptC
MLAWKLVILATAISWLIAILIGLAERKKERFIRNHAKK